MNYLIKYSLREKGILVIEKKQMCVRNKQNEYFAKGGLEKYLHKNYKFDEIIFHKCEIDPTDMSDLSLLWNLEDLKNKMGMK